MNKLKEYENQRQRVLITGVDGQDGSYLAEYLSSLNYEVYGIARSTNIKRLSCKVNLFVGDIQDANFVRHVVEVVRPRQLYNLAALSQVGNSFSTPNIVSQTNFIGLLNILQSIADCQLNCRVYQASTSEMFGSNFTMKKTAYDIIKVQNESTPFSANSPYAVSKIAAHEAVSYYRRTFNLFACCGILHNHESPRRGDSFVTKKITRFIGALKYYLRTKDLFFLQNMRVSFDGNPRLLLGNLDAYRDWSHAKDMVKAMHLMLNQDSPKDYVVGSGITRSVRDFCKAAFEVAELDYRDFILEDSEEFLRLNEVPYLRADASKIKQELDWTPEISFEELVEEMVHYDIQNYSR